MQYTKTKKESGSNYRISIIIPTFNGGQWTKEDGQQLKRHLEIEFEEKKNHDIYWDDVAMFCYPDEYEMGIYPRQEGDIVEIDSLE